MMARWYSYLQRFNFVIKYKSGKLNRVADALSKRSTLLTMLSTQITEFDSLKETYTTDEVSRQFGKNALDITIAKISS